MQPGPMCIFSRGKELGLAQVMGREVCLRGVRVACACNQVFLPCELCISKDRLRREVAPVLLLPTTAKHTAAPLHTRHA